MQPVLCFEPEPVPKLPGPAVGPNGPKICQKPGAGFIILSSLRSAQSLGSRAPLPQERHQPLGRRSQAAIEQSPVRRLGAGEIQKRDGYLRNPNFVSIIGSHLIHMGSYTYGPKVGSP